MDKQKREDSKKKKSGQVAPFVTAAKQLYDGTVIKRACDRAGKNPNIKGHIFEVMTCDKVNANPINIIQGRKAVLTKSTTAVRDDVVIKQGKKVVGRMQLKDTPKSIKDTIKRVGNKQYQGTKLVGTKETAEAYAKTVAKGTKNGSKITQKMTTNNISSAQTELLAKKALGGTIIESGKEISKQSFKSGISSAVISATIEGAKGINQIRKGEKTVKDVGKNIAGETAITAASAVAGDAVATTVTIMAAPLLGPSTIPVSVATSVATSTVTDTVLRKTANKVIEKNQQAQENVQPQKSKGQLLKRQNNVEPRNKAASSRPKKTAIIFG